jgi:hypothetical protein
MEHIQTIRQYPRIMAFLSEKGVTGIEKLPSLWRKDNVVLKVHTGSGKDYVFKEINAVGAEIEPAKMFGLKQAHPEVIPEIFFIEENAYLMEFISGRNFFELPEDERLARVYAAGIGLNATYTNGHHPQIDLTEKIRASFERYRKKAKAHYSNPELRLGKKDFDIFSAVPSQISHNDLNAANLLYRDSGGIALIDADDDGFYDIAKDVGRYCASIFFNNYDYFGNSKKKSLDIAKTFLASFDPSTLERARYFMGESFLSFINFDTKSTCKSVLKSLAINLLQGRPRKIMHRLEDGLDEK